MNNILLISSNSSSKGGGERYLVYLTRGFIKLNYQVTILLSNVSFMDTWAESFKYEGANVMRMDLVPLVNRKLRFVSSIFDCKQISKIQNFCIHLKPDSIIVNQQYDEDGLDYIKGALNYAPSKVIAVLHMPMTSNKDSRPFGIFRGMILREWYKKNCFKHVFVSEGSKNEFIDYYKLSGKYYVVNNGFPINGIKTPKMDKLFDNNFPTLAFIGQINSQKNLGLLIESWISLNKNKFDCNLLIIGDGPLRNEILNLLQKSGLFSNFHLMGWTNEPEIYYDQIDVFVMTSLYEGLPLSLIEIAGVGIPCVLVPFNGSTDVARHAYWVKVSNNYSVDEISGLVINAFSCNSISNFDLEQFKSYFSVDRVCDDLIKIFKQ